MWLCPVILTVILAAGVLANGKSANAIRGRRRRRRAMLPPGAAQKSSFQASSRTDIQRKQRSKKEMGNIFRQLARFSLGQRAKLYKARSNYTHDVCI